MLQGPEVVAALKTAGVSHVIWIPDSELGAWEPALTGAAGLSLIRVCREGEAIAIAAGLMLGGQTPVVIIQCTGLFEAGDALRNVVHDLQLPLFMIVGVRGYYLHQVGKTADTCPIFAEPILRAWQIPYVVLDQRHTADDIARAYAHALSERRAGALDRGVGIMRMTQQQALEVMVPLRGTRIVVTTMSSAAIWPRLADSPLDFAYIPSAMGHAPGLGLGLALAHPARGVIVVNGDGCMLMNLGSLVTLAEQAAQIFLLVLDNGLYEVTGGQAYAGAGQVDFAALARGAGIKRVYAFDTLAIWQAGAAEALTGSGPVFIWLKVEGRHGQKTPKPPRPMREQIERLEAALATGR